MYFFNVMLDILACIPYRITSRSFLFSTTAISLELFNRQPFQQRFPPLPCDCFAAASLVTMPLWTQHVNTKIEVDDDDLPLSKHRIFDDEGRLKTVESMRLVSGRSGAAVTPLSTKKTSAPAVKRSPTKATASAASRSRSVSASKSPSPVASTAPPVAPKSRSAAVGATASSPSAAAGRHRQASATRAKSSSKLRSRKASSTPSRKSPSVSSASPNPDWTVAALKEFAKKIKVDVTGLRRKEELLTAIQKQAALLK